MPALGYKLLDQLSAEKAVANKINITIFFSLLGFVLALPQAQAELKSPNLKQRVQAAAIAGEISPDDLFDLQNKIDDLQNMEQEAQKDDKGEIKAFEQGSIDRMAKEIENSLKRALIRGKTGVPASMKPPE